MSNYRTPAEFDHMLSLLYAYDDLDWRTIEGVRQAVVPLYGAQPEFIRDDDLVRWEWWEPWQPPDEMTEDGWADFPAVILLHRDDRNRESGA